MKDVFNLSSFTVTFSDSEELVIHDIILFEDNQKEEIGEIAREYTKFQIQKVEKYGKDLSYLSDEQKRTVLSIKYEILEGKTSEELLDNYNAYLCVTQFRHYSELHTLLLKNTL